MRRESLDWWLRASRACTTTSVSSGCAAKPRPAGRAAVVGKRDQPAAEPGQQVDARQAGPLAVRRQQLCRLLRFDPTAAQGGAELDQTEIADGASLVAAESLERDDADRPRAESAFASKSCSGCLERDVPQPLEVERAAEPHQSCAAARVQAERAQLCRGIHAQ